MMSSEEDPDSMALLEDKALKTKTKRVRQRVDAGEPRNSYASIPNFSSRPQQQNNSGSLSSPYHPNGYTNKMLCDLLGARLHSKEDPSSAMILDSESRSAVNGANAVSLSNPSRLFLNGSCDLSSLYGPSRVGATDSPPTPDHNSSSSSNSSSSHLLRDILQQGRKQQQLGGDYNGSSPPGQHVLGPLLKGNSTSGGHGPETTAEGGEIPDGSRSRTPPEKADLSEDSSAESKTSCRMSELQDSAPAAAPISPSPADGILIPPSPASSRSCSPPSTTPNATWQSPGANNVNNSSTNALEVKRARVETIVSNMLQGPMRPHSGNAGLSEQSTPVNGCKKRKLYQPQQHETTSRPPIMNGGDDVYEEDEDGDDEDGPMPKRRNTELHTFKQQLRQMQQQLVAMQQQYLEMMDGDSTDDEMCSVPAASPRRNSTVPGHMNNNTPLRSREDQQTPEHSDNEDHKPRLQDMKDSRILVTQSKTFLDYDNASMYDDQRRHVTSDQHSDKMANSSREERTVLEDDALKSNMQESRQSCIVRPPSYSEIQGSNLDYEWLAESLKAELSTSLSQVVDTVMSRCLQRKSMSKINSSEQETSKDTTLSQMLDRKSPRTKVIDRGTRVNGHGLSGLRTSPYPPDMAAAPKPPFYFPLKPPTSAAAAAAATAAFLYGSPPQLPPLSMPQPYQSPVHSTPTPQSLTLDMPEQTEAMSLVVTPKKKRHKVTDTRLNPRQALGLRGGQETENHSPKYPTMLGSLPPSDPMPPSHLYSHHPPPPPLVPVSLPTTVAIPNPSLNQSDLFHGFAYDPHRMAHYGMEPPEEDSMPHTTPSSLHPLLTSHSHQRGSPDSMHYSHHLKQDSGDISDQGDNNSPVYEPGMALISFPRHFRGSNFGPHDERDISAVHTSTLTPMHLRKAKLMFFYARYPSSAVLKMYFPDIKFNKNNTAQLVKWFSNFREFYYIQMEKYARQAMSEGIKTPEDIKVTLDSELLRVLNLHYNRNNHIEAPENFRYVVEQTLREFFKALVAGKDTEQSWKKSIYKIIARLDDNVPEYFKSPNFLETLE